VSTRKIVCHQHSMAALAQKKYGVRANVAGAARNQNVRHVIEFTGRVLIRLYTG
jgi:hypothetical protein